jgi:hypothetical protein
MRIRRECMALFGMGMLILAVLCVGGGSYFYKISANVISQGLCNVFSVSVYGA